MFKMKKLLSLALAVTMITGMSTSAFAAESINTTDAITFASNVVEDSYRNRELGENNDISTRTTNEVFQLLDTKADLVNYQTTKYGTVRNSYNIQVIPRNQDEIVINGNTVSFELQVLRSWMYAGNESRSTSSEVLDITVQKNTDGSYLVTECYIPTFCTRFGNLDQAYKSSLVQKNCSNFLDNFKQEFKEETNTKAIQMMQDKQLSRTFSKEVEPRALGYISRTDAANWARSNYNKNQPTSSTSSVSYYDFSEITNAYDCTNFASHALLAGGAPMHDDGGSGIVGTSQWYYRNLSNRSSSWSGVTQLGSFLLRSNPSSTNIGPYAELMEVSYANAYKGDVIQYEYGGDSTWDHSTIVTSYDGGVIHVTGRTGDNWFNDNVPVHEMGGTQRLLHIEGYCE